MTTTPDKPAVSDPGDPDPGGPDAASPEQPTPRDASQPQDTDRSEVSPAGAAEVPPWLATSAALAWRFLVLAAAAAVAFWIVARLYLVTVPIGFALIFAVLFEPPTRWLRARGWPSVWATLVTVGSGIAVVVGLVGLFASRVIGQFQRLAGTLESAREVITGWVRTGPLNLSAAQLDQLIADTLNQLQSNANAIITGVLNEALLVVEILAGVVLCMVLTVFFVKDGRSIASWCQRQLPSARRELAGALAGRAWYTLGRYVRGAFLVALINSVGIGVVLLALGVPLAFSLMALTFFGAFFPVVGAFLSGLAAVLVALVDGGATEALIVLAAVVVVQQLEGNVLQPVIMGREVPLHPVAVLVALTVGGVLGGIAGAALGVPIAASLSAMGNELGVRRDRSHPELTAGGDAASADEPRPSEPPVASTSRLPGHEAPVSGGRAPGSVGEAGHAGEATGAAPS
jgi:predicted PurR-regulated permease PerM